VQALGGDSLKIGANRLTLTHYRLTQLYNSLITIQNRQTMCHDSLMPIQNSLTQQNYRTKRRDSMPL